MRPEKPEFESQSDPVLNTVIVLKICQNLNNLIFEKKLKDSCRARESSDICFALRKSSLLTTPIETLINETNSTSDKVRRFSNL